MINDRPNFPLQGRLAIRALHAKLQVRQLLIYGV